MGQSIEGLRESAKRIFRPAVYEREQAHLLALRYQQIAPMLTELGVHVSAMGVTLDGDFKYEIALNYTEKNEAQVLKLLAKAQIPEIINLEEKQLEAILRVSAVRFSDSQKARDVLESRKYVIYMGRNIAQEDLHIFRPAST